ncbi:protein-methionine-sulfoxide reductase catalytic subunit MsrP [Aliiroseovarius zhejiangensis]|uniref:Protein-methionine-sulfoxide reductase catalytic subunit MsrP n=1 Tax=Aliiroseovarius zhejiangensis TaxID=1632025 RepID=A0ABQ3JAJ0_9RHOB|nr:protein-methionine-sulfoxide reductase catalytic subunit MsrP [Aliiroseovarius zhejiangensis]GHF08448.1 protein-methionine-sulfoxide reductase catalytic subunit MsrP [Aliiroseovarius zhejiangensis]
MAYKTVLKYSDVTPRADYLNRRQLMGGAAGLTAGLTLGPALGASSDASPYSADLETTALEDISSYNNFYEFGTGKTDPAKHAHQLTIDPWSVEIGGMVDRPGTYGLEDILGKVTLEERIYRFRCVETWSMVVPWVGFELNQLLSLAGVQGAAKYVAFETLYRPDEMPGQKTVSLEWPYREGLRLDEAMHPLTILATGIYDDPMPKQNGAPLRLVVPWKYGYKSIKSIVRVTLTDKEPQTTWNMLQPSEYGFYSNVNPQVSHPRWSQAYEKPIGGGLFAKRQETLMFNGYEEEVARLYDGMDLVVNH